MPLKELSPDLADIAVRCPIPGHEDAGEMRLADFYATEVGQQVLGDSIDNIAKMEQAGIAREQAIGMALGAAAVKTETGEIARMPEDPSKKKF